MPYQVINNSMSGRIVFDNTELLFILIKYELKIIELFVFYSKISYSENLNLYLLYFIEKILRNKISLKCDLLKRSSKYINDIKSKSISKLYTGVLN